MPENCAVYGCSNTQKPEEGLSLHAIPFDGDEHPEAKKRRKRWVDFVSRTRAKWKPAKHTRICLQHFKANDFAYFYANVVEKENLACRWLQRHDVGIVAYPTSYPTTTSEGKGKEEKPKELTAREKQTYTFSEISFQVSYK